MSRCSSRFISLAGLMIILASISSLTFNVQRIRASGTIYIRANGLVEGTDKIITADNVTYTFIGNISDSIVVERSNIIVDGTGYTLRGSGSGTGLNLTGSIDTIKVNNVTIKSLKIQNFSYGIYVTWSSNNSIHGNLIADNVLGIYLHDLANKNSVYENNITGSESYGIYALDSNYNNISRNIIVETKGWGLEFSGSEGNDISENNITGNGYGIVLAFGDYNILRNNIMKNNTFNFKVEIGMYGGGLHDDVDISNSVDGKPIYYWVNIQNTAVPIDAGYVALVNCSHISVQDLNLTKNGEGVLLAFTKDSTITNSNIAKNYYGILLIGSSNNSIGANKVEANCQAGIYLENSDNNNISENNLAANYYTSLLSYNLFIGWSSHNRILGNNITSNNYCGACLVSSKNNTIAGNNIVGNGWAGMANWWPGIELDDSSNNSIYQNRIEENAYGIYFGYPYGSSNNTFFHNNIIENGVQVHFYQSGYANSWDNGIEGNYWSDYTGTDANHDGIGDSPYTVNSNNTDHYPLMTPYPIPEFPSFLILPILMIATLMVVTVYKRKQTN